jgi:hypothetical protein
MVLGVDAVNSLLTTLRARTLVELYVTTTSIRVALIVVIDCGPPFHWVNNTSLRNTMSS